jgi:hypothetical protein
MNFEEKYVDNLIKESFEALVKLLEMDFKTHETKDGITVSTLKIGDEPYLVKGEGILPHSSKEIYSLINPSHGIEIAQKFIPKISERNLIQR